MESSIMNARTVIADAIDVGQSRTTTTQSILDALRAAAGGADRVVFAWEPTPCPDCRYAPGGLTEEVLGKCTTCGGSGVDGYTVTLAPSKEGDA